MHHFLAMTSMEISQPPFHQPDTWTSSSSIVPALGPLATRAFDWSVATSRESASLAVTAGPSPKWHAVAALPAEQPKRAEPTGDGPYVERQAFQFDERTVYVPPCNDKLKIPVPEVEEVVVTEKWERVAAHRMNPFHSAGPAHLVDRYHFPNLDGGGAPTILPVQAERAAHQNTDLSCGHAYACGNRTRLTNGPEGNSSGSSSFHQYHRQMFKPVAMAGYRLGGSGWRLTQDARVNGVEAGCIFNGTGVMDMRGGEATGHKAF